MQIAKKFINCALILLLCNTVFLWNTLSLAAPIKVLDILVLTLCYAGILIRPHGGGALPSKLKTLGGGCDLMLITAICTVVQLAIYLWLWLGSAQSFSPPVWTGNIVLSLILLIGLLAGGLIRLTAASGQITIGERVACILLW